MASSHSSDAKPDVQICVKTLSGRTISIDMDSKKTILSIKEKLAEKTGVPVFAQVLVFAGKAIPNNASCADYYDHFYKEGNPSMVVSEAKISEASYKELPEAFRKHISEHTQTKRHAMIKGNKYPSVEEYWNMLVEKKSPDCIALFKGYLIPYNVLPKPDEKKQDGGCSIM